MHVLSSLFTVTTMWGDILWRILPLTEPEPEPELDLLGKSFKYTSCEIFGFNSYEIMTFCCCECIKCAIILFTRMEICWWCHRHMMVVSCIDWCSYYCSYFSSSFSLPAGLPRSGKLPVLFLLSSQKSTFWPLAEKLWITSKNDTFYDGHDELYHHANFGEDRTMRAGCRCENVVFVTIFFCYAPSPEHRAFEGCIVRTRTALPFIGRFWPNNIRGGKMSVRTSVRPSVCPSVHKKYLRFLWNLVYR